MREAGKDTSNNIEEQIAQVDDFFRSLTETGEVKNVPRDTMRQVLESCGAKLELDDDGRTSLKKHTNAKRAKAMRQIWDSPIPDPDNESRYDYFKRWSNDWARELGETRGRTLPVIKQESKVAPGKINTHRNSGMLQLLGTVTAYAALSEEELPFERFQELLETRAWNGRVWMQDLPAESRDSELSRISVPTSQTSKAPSSFPPEFPNAMFEEMRAWITK